MHVLVFRTKFQSGRPTVRCGLTGPCGSSPTRPSLPRSFCLFCELLNTGCLCRFRDVVPGDRLIGGKTDAGKLTITWQDTPSGGGLRFMARNTASRTTKALKAL